MSKSEYTKNVNLNEEKKKRMYFVAIIIPIMIAVTSWLSSLIFNDFSESSSGKLSLNLITVIGILVGGLSFAMGYLQHGFGKNKYSILKNEEYLESKNEIEDLYEILSAENKIINNKIIEMEERLVDYNKSKITDEDYKNLVVQLRNNVVNQAGNEVMESIAEKLSENKKLENSYRDIKSIINSTTERLNFEISSLGRRGNLNLVLGALTSVIGLLILGFSVLYSDIKFSSINDFLYAFFPRLSLVLLIQLFSFFFLSLYKTSLSEIKYFQNEITNIQLKSLALISAYKYNNSEIMGSLLNSIIITERNFILKNGETTVDLESAKINKDSNKDIYKLLTDIFKKND